jgi:signal transduction histidine kinase
MNSNLQPVERAQLRDFLVNHFGQDELELLAFDLGVDYELLSYQNKQKLSLELVAYFEHRNRLGCLLTEVIRRRPINNLTELLKKIPSCLPQTKIQIITYANQEVANEVEAFLEHLAQKYNLDREELSLIATTRGSLHLLLSLPEVLVTALQQPGSQPAGYSVEITPFAALPERSQKIWRMIALEWPPVALHNKLLPSISWQKAAEIHRLKEKEELLRRLMAGDRFGAHGTRSTLAALSGYAQLLSLTAVPGEKQANYLGKLVQASDDLSDSLTLLHSLIGARVEEVAIQSVLQYLLPDVAPIAEQAGIQLDLDVAAGLSTSQQHIRCNLVLLAQAVRALVRHAVFRSGENGRIWLSAYLEDNRLVIQVQDEAEPIPAEIADAVFEPQGQWSNERVHDPAQAGSGLSLPLVKMIIEQMDAKIWFDPAIEPGNTFDVAFPLVI